MSKIEVNQISSQCGSTLTIGQSGDTVTLASGATAAGFGSTGEVSWDTTKKTTGFTAVSGVGYFCDTTSAAFTVTLPATPSAGNVVAVSDYNGTAGTNSITVGRNSSNINGAADDYVISKSNSSVQFIYIDATVGWQTVFTGSTLDTTNPFIVATGGTITCCGDYKIHTFTGPGNFTVTNAGSPAGSTTVDYLVLAGAGGGGGGFWHFSGGGGGGAGGFRESSGAASGCYSASPLGAGVSALPVTASPYPITVGGGGSGGPAGGFGTSGSNSIFSTITSAGGGGGGAAGPAAPPTTAGISGGSGGGGGGKGGTPAPTLPGGAGNTPPVSPPQGNPGGYGDGVSPNSGGGGGGASSVGTDAVTGCGSFPFPGGSGATTSISASPTTYAEGGPGSECAAQIVGGNNTGDGGSGNRFASPGCGPFVTGSNGGSGIVIIRYKYQ